MDKLYLELFKTPKVFFFFFFEGVGPIYLFFPFIACSFGVVAKNPLLLLFSR